MNHQVWVSAGIGLAGLSLGCVDADTPMDANDHTEIVFEVPAGSTAQGIGPSLVESGLVSSGFQWKMYIRQQESNCLKAGKFALRKSMNMAEIWQTLCGAPIPDDVPFTVLEGWRIDDIDGALAAKDWIAPGEYAAIATAKSATMPFDIGSPTLEGYLYPETYLVPQGDKFSAKTLIERQLGTFQERFIVPHGESLGERTLHEVVVMASMIEREEPTPSQRHVVAGILWKRLDNNWQLGVDATSRYKLEDWSDEKTFRKMLRVKEDPYNTRLNHGLPPTAIGNPTQSALEASIRPEESEFWYYLHDKDGVFHGGRDAAHHAQNRRTYNVY